MPPTTPVPLADVLPEAYGALVRQAPADLVPDPLPPFEPEAAHDGIVWCDSWADRERRYGDVGRAEFWRNEAEDFRRNPPPAWGRPA